MCLLGPCQVSASPTFVQSVFEISQEIDDLAFVELGISKSVIRRLALVGLLLRSKTACLQSEVVAPIFSSMERKEKEDQKHVKLLADIDRHSTYLEQLMSGVLEAEAEGATEIKAVDISGWESARRSAKSLYCAICTGWL
ncbi:uncharacterized protein BKCO1_800034, partial [Diplodia corticola]